MDVKTLKHILSKYPKRMEVILACDPKGNEFRSLDRYNDGL